MLNPADSTSLSQNMKEGEFYLPDEIAVEILSRVPAIDVVRLRSVCKRWRDLTCSHTFTLLHLRHCLPMLLTDEYSFYDSKFCRYEHYLLDQWWEPLQTSLKIYRSGQVSEFKVRFSNDGLIVMGYGKYHMIMNPLYHEKVYTTLSEDFWSGEIYGVFFNPSLKEYCTLWRLGLLGEFTNYKILNLGSKPCWRDINNPCSDIARLRSIPPVLIDEHLYWMVKPEASYEMGMTLSADIMEFDIRKEEFIFISSPIPEPYRCSEYNIKLFDIGGRLSLVRTSPSEEPPINKPFEVNIWTLKDHTARLWTMSSYSINTDSFCAYPRPMALVNDELLVHDYRHLYTCNLKLGTLRIFDDERKHALFFTTHVMSLVSLRKCKSEIYMNKRGEVERNRKRRGGDFSGGVDDNSVTMSDK